MQRLPVSNKQSDHSVYRRVEGPVKAWPPSLAPANAEMRLGLTRTPTYPTALSIYGCGLHKPGGENNRSVVPHLR